MWQLAKRDMSHYSMHINSLSFLSFIGLHCDRFLKPSHSDQAIRGRKWKLFYFSLSPFMPLAYSRQ